MENLRFSKPLENNKAYADWARWCSDNGYEIKEENSGYYCNKINLNLEEEKERKIYEINAVYERKASLIKVGTPESEILTWDIQKSEAELWYKDNTHLTPFINGLAAARQVERTELINKILVKVAAFNSYMSNITGQRQYYEDRIKSASSTEDLCSIIWE